MTPNHVINIAKEFSDLPYGRDERDGLFNGKKFREDYLLPALETHDVIVIEMDGTLGYGSSFLDEAFAGLIKSNHMDANEVLRRIKFEYSKQSVLKNIRKYIDEASKR